MKITEAKWVQVGELWKFVLEGDADKSEMGHPGKDWSRHRRADWGVEYQFDKEWHPLHRTGSRVLYAHCTLNLALHTPVGSASAGRP